MQSFPAKGDVIRDQKGFTLIELLIVIIVIALLASLLIPKLLVNSCSSRQNATQHLIDNLAQAAKNYEFDENEYPLGTGVDSSDLVETGKSPAVQFR